ncbi:hypothetical protein [Hafnia paralvei]|uniref:hypothetical protein n=1 Tax=Hafnia paralvei TaxID=546367 RepID=UPI000FDA3548|nr:hypothetical protein [Hafnia paralvei]
MLLRTARPRASSSSFCSRLISGIVVYTSLGSYHHCSRHDGVGEPAGHNIHWQPLQLFRRVVDHRHTS